MPYNHILVTGEAGHGKDTVADYFAEKLGYKSIAFADLQKKEVIDSYANSPQPVDIIWLNIRETKETPDPRLALMHCSDKNYISVALKSFEAEDKIQFDAVRNFVKHPGSFLDLASTIKRQSISIASGNEEFSIQERLELPRSPRRITQVWGTEYRRQSEYGHDRYWIDPVDQTLKESNTPYAVRDGRTLDELTWADNSEIKRIHVVRPGYGTKIAKHVTEMIPPPNQKTIILENSGSLQDLYDLVDKVVIPAVKLVDSNFAPKMRP